MKSWPQELAPTTLPSSIAPIILAGTLITIHYIYHLSVYYIAYATRERRHLPITINLYR
jgi:hypothetical protein